MAANFYLFNPGFQDHYASLELDANF